MTARPLKFVDLFAGLGGFHRALESLGHQCVFACEIDPELREKYRLNYPDMRGPVEGDIRDPEVKRLVPSHDILCAGFPCQPFSKSGAQLGTKDETRGTLFHEILDILRSKAPRYVLLENVGNFARHDGGRTWRIVRQKLEALGYRVTGTEHRTPKPRSDWRDSGAIARKRRSTRGESLDELQYRHGLISPHHFGHPHHRERFFIVASKGPLPHPPFPLPDLRQSISLTDLMLKPGELAEAEREEAALTPKQLACIEHWNRLLRAIPKTMELPSFPIWGDELYAKYPYESVTPWASSTRILRESLTPKPPKYTRKEVLLERLPSYARERRKTFRHWKVRFIYQNREWWKEVRPYLPKGWASELKSFPPSLRKLEWNAKGEVRNLWRHVLQFRPSGLRVKRYTSSPALVAMTSTQIPILGPQRRFLTAREGLLLQGFPGDHVLPKGRDAAFRALGNAVHVDVVRRIAMHLLSLNQVGSPISKEVDSVAEEHALANLES